MRISLRQRKTGKEKTALYLDILQNGKRTRESLDLFLINNPKNKFEQLENKKTLDLAERLKSERLIEIQDDKFGTNRTDNRKDNFITYFEKLTENRRPSAGNHGNWLCCVLHFKKCFGNILLFEDLTVTNCLKFREYLDQKARTPAKVALAQNSKYSYLNKFKAALKEAYKERLIGENLSDFIPGFKPGESSREYLTFEEVQSLVNTTCTIPVLKQAFLFSCLTGIRWSDIQRLCWENLRYTEKRGYELSFRQQKTGGKEYLPISEQAVSLLGERGPEDGRIFVGLQYSSSINNIIVKWMQQAGVRKKISFHCARHTHAVLLLENGADIYTVSKMLGHRDLKTTQIYAKVVDSKKIEAVKLIPKLVLG